MRFISLFLFIFFVMTTGCEKIEISDAYPDYRLIKRFSERLEKKEGYILTSYGTSPNQTEESQLKYGKRAFRVSYHIPKNRNDVVSIEEARCDFISIVESILKEINSDKEVRGCLNVYPLTAEWVQLYIHYVDENGIEIGSGGVSSIFNRQEKIKYETYEIYEYTGKYPAQGNHSSLHQETYQEALEIVKQQGCLKHL